MAHGSFWPVGCCPLLPEPVGRRHCFLFGNVIILVRLHELHCLPFGG